MSRRKLKLLLVISFFAFFVLIILQTVVNLREAGAPDGAYVNILLFFTLACSVACIPGLISPRVYGFRMVKPISAVFMLFGMLIASKIYVNIHGSLPELPALAITFPKFHTASATVPPAPRIITPDQSWMKEARTYAGIPVSLSIPSAKISVAIEKVGITASGEMDAPKVPEQAGWYSLGPRPGMKGLAIILGHSGWVRGRKVAFDDLYLVKKGDVISVTDDAGRVHTYHANTVKKFSNDTPLSEMLGTAIGDGIVLITCSGDWDAEKKTYKERLVVMAGPA